MQPVVNGFTKPTLRASLEKILKGIEDGTLRSSSINRYTAPCALGLLMTPEQRADLFDMSIDGNAIDNPKVVDYLRVENIEFVTGMSFDQAVAVQKQHDSGDIRGLREALELILEVGDGVIHGEGFAL